MHAAYFAASYAAQQIAAKSDLGRKGPRVQMLNVVAQRLERSELIHQDAHFRRISSYSEDAL
jgi:hypothetical protein